jgi:hypothetical protein
LLDEACPLRPLKLKADGYAFSFYALDIVRDTISRLYAQGMPGAFLQGNPVERIARWRTATPGFLKRRRGPFSISYWFIPPC